MSGNRTAGLAVSQDTASFADLEATDSGRRVEAVWAYHRLGVNVALLRPGTRQTTHRWRRWGAGEERQTEADVRTLLVRADYSHFDVALLLGGGLAALDVDSEPFADLIARSDGVAEWMASTARVRTGSGKAHYFGRYDPAAERVPRTWRHHEDDVHGELLAAGALVVAPPSRHHRTGRTYEWEVPLDAALPLPEALYGNPWAPRRAASYSGAVDADDHDAIRGVGRIERGRQAHYFDIALQGVRRDLAGLSDGRKQSLHTKAFHIGANVATDRYDLQRARRALMSACLDNGLVSDLEAEGVDGEAYCWDVITRALRAGWRRAREEAAAD